MANWGWLVRLLATEAVELFRSAVESRQAAKQPDEPLDVVAAGIAMSSGAAASREGRIAERIGVVESKQALKEQEIRQRIVRAAQSELGKSDASKYWSAVLPESDTRPPPKHWCGAGYLWCLQQAGLLRDARWIRGAGLETLLRRNGAQVQYTKSPLPGDMAYFTKSEHHAVVVEETPGSFVHLVNFNGDGGRVTANAKLLKNVSLFYSISGLVRQLAERELAAESEVA